MEYPKKTPNGQRFDVDVNKNPLRVQLVAPPKPVTPDADSYDQRFSSLPDPADEHLERHSSKPDHHQFINALDTMRPTIMRAAAQAAKAAKGAETDVLKKGAKRDPELFILGGIMTGALGLAGYYFGRKPTSSTSEAKARGEYKYKYHPGADPKNPPKDAPSALHSVIVPNVNLPKVLHDKYNKWGKDEF
ncbi:uncharacterized protein L3040_006142 [Drepanopeziza brunnea f. sp. 'multigermtubi']|uniref:uncharacterized protein n=1 Tax=Drepanopeziza brunnea f. sp. 'multigermtubi' TaxID=698441 RepID=UPI0023A77AEE|nr:hypothetical protein L3040_006142 [Drepanopeziza brunnea f. sp. 'multigermtubi']